MNETIGSVAVASDMRCTFASSSTMLSCVIAARNSLTTLRGTMPSKSVAIRALLGLEGSGCPARRAPLAKCTGPPPAGATRALRALRYREGSALVGGRLAAHAAAQPAGRVVRALAALPDALGAGAPGRVAVGDAVVR